MHLDELRLQLEAQTLEASLLNAMHFYAWRIQQGLPVDVLTREIEALKIRKAAIDAEYREAKVKG